MRRFDSGEWLLIGVVLVLVLAAVFTILRMTWRSPEIRDVPATETPTPRAVAVFTVTPESLFRATATATPTPLPPLVLDPVLLTPASTRVPTSTPTVTTTVAPTPDKPAVQRG